MTLAAFAAWIVNYQALAAAVLLVATLAGLLVRQPARRAALDWATLAGLLVLAGLSALPGWPRVALFERPAILEQPDAKPPAPALVNAERPSLPPRELAPRFDPRPPRAATQPVAAPLPTPVPPQIAPPPKPEPWRWSDLAAPLALAYLAGMGLVVAWLLWGAVESWRLVRRAGPPADDLLATLASLAEGKSPRLLVSSDVSAAAALGALRPTILVTPQLAAAPADVVRAVLAHELAHLRHGDLWILALGRAGLLLLYPQPLYWWLRRRAADAREALADAAAAGAADRTQYAELLVAAARTLSGPPRRGPALAILERPSQLGRRIKLLLDPRGAIELRSSRRWRWLGAAAAAAVVLAASLVQVMPAAVGQAEPEATQSHPVAAEESTHRRPARAVEYTEERSASTTGLSPRAPRMIAAPSKWSRFQLEDNVADPQWLPANGPRVRKLQELDPPEVTAARVYRPVQPDAAGALTYRSMVVDRETGMPVEGAKVVVKRYDYGAGSMRSIAESEAKTNDVGEFSFTLPAEQVASPRMYLAFDIQHPGYVQQYFHGGELSAVRAREQMGVAPEFQKLELAPGAPIFGQIVTPAGQPLAGLAVRYLTMSPNAHGSSEGVRTESLTTTDAEGRFRFNGVRGGLTRLWVEPADYAPRTLLLGKRTGALGRIEVQAGQRLTGTLLDVDGRPVTNAWVRVGPKSYPFVQRTPGEQGQRTAKTNARGRFTLAPLLPGEYQASVSGRDPNDREAPAPETPLPAVFLTQLVTVGADAAANDVTLKAVPHVRVEVTRVDAQGAPVGDERFDAFLHGKLGDMLVAGESHRDRPGHITILAPRSLRETELSLGLNREGTVSYRRGQQGELTANRSLDLGTLDQDIDDILVLHKKSPTLIVQPMDSWGRAVDVARPRIDYPRGTLGAPESQRWPNGVEGQVMLGLQPDGRWRTEGLLPDQDFTLTLQLPDGQVVSRAFKLLDGQTEEVNIELPEVGPYLRVLDSVPRDAEKPEEGGFQAISDEGPMEEGGKGLSEQGSEAAADAPLYRAVIDFGPMEDESVEKTPQAGDGAAASEDRETEGFRLVWDEGPMENQSAEETTEASAEAGPVGPEEAKGPRWVWTEAPMEEPGGKSGANVATPPRSITRPEDLPKGFTAYRPGDTPPTPAPTALFGVVRDDQGQPVPGVKVDAWHWFAGNETTTDSKGRFELRGFEPHESLEIVFTKEGFSPLLRTDVKAGTLLEATLDDKTSVVGTIRDPAGQPVVGAVVRASHEAKLEDGDGVPLDFETKTDAEGRYCLLVARGNYDLWARKPGVGIAQRAFVLADPGRPETVDLQLEPGVRFEARLRDAVTSKPVVGAKLESQFADVQGVSDENGLLVLDELPRVELAFAVDAPGYARWWSPQSSLEPDHGNPAKAGKWQDDTGHLRFELSSARLNAEIELEPAVTLRGRVVDPKGAPVAGATLAANVTGQTGGVADTRFTTDAEGRFELHLPASGAVEYNLVAHDGDWRTSRNWANGYGEPLRTMPGQMLEGLELRLTKGANVRGRVVDVQGRPVVGKEVVAKADHPRANRYSQPRGTTDAAGRFELRNVEGGSNYVMVEEYLVPEEGPPGSWRRIEVAPGQEVNDMELIAKPTQAAAEFFQVSPAYTAELESAEQATERAAKAFQLEAEPE